MPEDRSPVASHRLIVLAGPTAVGKGTVAARVRLTHPEIWAFEGATMRESMESMLDADRDARFEHLQADRIDLS